MGREVFGRVSGLLDFETAVTGDRAYEFAGAGLLVPGGDPRLLGRMLAGYGHLRPVGSARQETGIVCGADR